MKLKLFYVETDMGCGIRKAKSEEQAWKNLLRAEGTNHALSVRLATGKDIAHVKAMGGHVPDIKTNTP